MPNNANKWEKLDKLNREMLSDIQTSRDLSASNPVFGEGSPDADIMIIGEAPGKKEDEEGTPFVGASGKLLDSLLESVSLCRSDVYITNTIKFRPPKNRDPHTDELAQGKKWLDAEIALVDPFIIITLGRIPLSRITTAHKISEIHGVPFVCEDSDSQCRVHVPLYHPAAALYNPKLRPTLFEDFARIPSILTSAKSTPCCIPAIGEFCTDK